jgi:hypothetical protein
MASRIGFIANIANFLIWLFIALAVLLHIFWVPFVAYGLQEKYTEYTGDGLWIQVMLSSIVLCGQLVLASVSILLTRIKKQQLLATSSYKYAQMLIASIFGLVGSFAVLFAWLNSENTVPPLIGYGLIFAMLFVSAIGFVTVSLYAALKEATATRLELEGVI